MNLIWLMRMKRWVQNPPSRRRVILVGWVVGLCFALAIFEAVFGWPEFLSVDPARRGPGVAR